MVVLGENASSAFFVRVLCDVFFIQTIIDHIIPQFG